MKVALVHYWLVNMAGGEKVLEALCRLYPQADIFTHVVDREKLLPEFRQHKISTTFINSLPASRRLYKKYLPLMPHALEQLDLTDYDLVISSESGPAKGVITRPDCLHVCYCHTPMRYLWDNWPAYMRSTGRLSRLAMRLLLPSLRQWDCLSAQRVDHFVANSRHVARRIRKYWRREAAVVHPPVDTKAFTPRAEPGGEHYLCFGRLASYKRVDLAVEVCTRLGRPLVVAGDGEMMQQLKAKAGPGEPGRCPAPLRTVRRGFRSSAPACPCGKILYRELPDRLPPGGGGRHGPPVKDGQPRTTKKDSLRGCPFLLS